MEADFVQIRNSKIATKTMTNDMQAMVKETAKHAGAMKSMFVHQKASLAMVRKSVEAAVKVRGIISPVASMACNITAGAAAKVRASPISAQTGEPEDAAGNGKHST